MIQSKMREAAVHEAGHAAMLELLDIPYDRVSIAGARTRCAGRWVSNVERTLDPVRRAFMVLTAGAAAQWVLLDRKANAQRRYIAKSDHDHVLAAKLLGSVTSDAGEINRLLRRTVDLLKLNTGAIDAISTRLMEQPTLTSREVGMAVGTMLVGCEPVMS
jgi:tRNA U34 5-carboxymethylaminomethyl modifying enzyme MnmG/GidA